MLNSADQQAPSDIDQVYRINWQGILVSQGETCSMLMGTLRNLINKESAEILCDKLINFVGTLN